MAINYQVTQGRNLVQPNGAAVFQARVVMMESISTRELCKKISDRCTVTAADVMGVIRSLVGIVEEHVVNSRIVRLGELGSFRISVSSDMVPQSTRWSASALRRPKMIFTPGPLLKQALKRADMASVGMSDKVKRYVADRDAAIEMSASADAPAPQTNHLNAATEAHAPSDAPDPGRD